MTGPHDSVLGRRVDRVLATTITFKPEYYDVASGDNRINGAVVEVDVNTGRAKSIERLSMSDEDLDNLS